LVLAQLSGYSLRSISQELGISVGKSFSLYSQALEKFPLCIDITRNDCSKFCGILLVDGKYIKVKGYERKIPVIYGVDYLTHDIIHFVLGTSENYRLLLKFFTSLRLANYPLQALVSDDNQNIPQTCLKVYPNAVCQLCQNHYKQNLRITLNLSNDPTYIPFMQNIETLFCRKMGTEEFKAKASRIYEAYKYDDLAKNVMLDIARRSGELVAYLKVPNTPRTTNLIESFNSHLEGRLKTIKGFESFKGAKLWLNAYFVRRRLKPFTDCTKQFKSLNGKSSLEITLKDSYKIENILKLIR
jgi:transposase-like protein